ncbi:hypothetical protein Unana1_01038 [Umbelopsis nana]
MSLLPTANAHGQSTSYPFDDPIRQVRRSSNPFPVILKRILRVPHMDFEFALWQMAYLLIAPRRVYRNIYYHKQTKNQWARDDPAFLVLMSILLCASAVAWGLVYGHGFLGICKMMLYMVFVDFILVGSFIASACWLLSNRFLRVTASHSIEQRVEWAYAFDVHCNAFFPVFLVLYVVQFFFIPILVRSSWISLLIGNTMYFLSFAWYAYGTFLGYNALPFLVHSELFLYPIGIFFILWIVSLFGFNVSRTMLQAYFGS